MRSAPGSDFTVFIGIDPSFSGTGVVCLEGDNVSIAEIKANPKENLYNRMATILNGVMSTIGHVNRQHALIAIETPVGGMASCTTMMLASLGTYLRIQLVSWWQLNVSPAHVKQFATGKGNAQKDVVLKDVYRRWQFNTDSNNIADAYVLARVAKAWCEGGELEYEKKALKSIRSLHEKSWLSW